jgi:hypothetical protein
MSATADASDDANSSSSMPRWQRAYVIATCAVIGGAFAYAACDWGQWPRLAYLPTREMFTFSPPANAIMMLYPGLVAWGFGGMLTGALVGAGLCTAFKRSWSDRVLQLFGGWAITAIVLAGAYYTWGSWPW